MHRVRYSRCVLTVVALGLTVVGCGLLSNKSPVAVLMASAERALCSTDVEFDGHASYDPDGHLVRWSWEFGDGGQDIGQHVIHHFEEPGTYIVRLSVRDNRGATSVATVSIEIVNDNAIPIARIDARPSQGEAPLLVTCDGTASSDDDGDITHWAWEFGDGQTAEGSTVSHSYLNPGTYTIQLTVTDDLGGQGSTSLQVTVSGTATGFQRQFEWDYAGQHFSWTISIPTSLYYEYRSRVRGWWPDRDYDEYVLDPLDDDYLDGLVDWIQAHVGTDFYRTVECAFNFVQAGIDYRYDPRWHEYPKYPLETLVDKGGDCEDTAILYASLVRTLGAGAMLAAVDTNGDDVVDHMVTLVPVSQADADSVVCDHGCGRSFWTYNGQLYAFAETTGEPGLSGYYFKLGCDPWGLTSVDFKITWDVSRVTVNPKFEQFERSVNAE